MIRLLESCPMKHQKIDLLKGLVAGVAGGLLGSLAMEQFQAAWSKATKALQSEEEKDQGSGDSGDKPEPATVQVAQTVSQNIFGRELPERYKPAAGEAVHYAMGATSAAAYGMLA